MNNLNSMPLILFAFIAGAVLAMTVPQEKLDLNSASEKELTDLPGIGPSHAASIIKERNLRGGFRTVDDLLKVQGIGRKLVARLRPYVIVKIKNGLNKRTIPNP
jgi:competence protein ComEA